MRKMMWLAPALAIAAALPARAQTVVLRPRASTTAGVTVTTEGAVTHASVTGTNVDVRTVFRDLVLKSKANIVLAPNAAGRLRQAIPSQPLDAAIRTIASGAGLSVRTITVPSASAAKITPETAGALAAALSDVSVNAVVTDPATGRNVTLTFSSAAPKPEPGAVTVYYIMRPPRRASALATSGAVQDAVANAAAAFGDLPLNERFQAMRALQMRVFEGMTPEERDQMGPGGPGGRGFGPRGPGGPDGTHWDGHGGPPGPEDPPMEPGGPPPPPPPM